MEALINYAHLEGMVGRPLGPIHWPFTQWLQPLDSAVRKHTNSRTQLEIPCVQAATTETKEEELRACVHAYETYYYLKARAYTLKELVKPGIPWIGIGVPY